MELKNTQPIASEDLVEKNQSCFSGMAKFLYMSPWE